MTKTSTPQSPAPAEAPSARITVLLDKYRKGDDSVMSELMVLVEPELHRLAAGYLKRERGDHTLQPTALVNEAYLVLFEQREKAWENRSHFLAVAALVMRQVLVQYARRRKAQKREGNLLRVTMDDQLFAAAAGTGCELEALDEALKVLAEESPRQSRVIELRFFGGLTVEEIAQVLQISATTVKREWTAGRAWLFQRLSEGSDAE